ncbi:unnamed protein product [Ophioblennius macclurei]
MWCYRKPDFQTLLISELQRQQQRSQFCDVVLQAKGVSVPAHSCVLSAISPFISSSLPSSPLLPAGMRQPVDCQALDSCTLLHMVELFYSGEMNGEGETEKQEAIYAAAKLGIDGLVEVTRRDSNRGPQREAGLSANAGVQTEPAEKARTRWRREVRDGTAYLWKETVSDGGQDVWTQTEEFLMNPGSPHPPASFQTIDMSSLQSLGQINSQLVPAQIVPVSVVYDQNQWTHGSSVPFEGSAVGGTQCIPAPGPSSLLHYSSQVIPEMQAGWSAPQMAPQEIADQHFEQFDGNIPGFISHFLNPEEGGSRGRRAGRRRRAARGGMRRGGTAARRRPRGKLRGRGRGTLTQMVDVQEVSAAAGRLQKLFRHRLAGRPSRSGQGGGAAGRRLQVKTRELVISGATRQRKRASLKVWEFSQTGDLQLCRHRGGRRGGGIQWERRMNITPLVEQSGSSAHRTLTLRKRLSSEDVATLTPPSAARHCSPSAATSFLPPAASLLHTCSLPLPVSSNPPEHIDRLLEEVMMGLDILPSSGAVASLSQNQQQSHASNRHGSPEDAGGAAGSRPAGLEASVPQQVREGEMNRILDQFLQSFEQYVGGEEMQTGAESRAVVAQPHGRPNARAPQPSRRPQATKDKSGETPPSSSQPLGAFPPRRTKPPAKKRRKEHPLQEKKKVKLQMAVTVHDVDVADSGQVEKQLQQIPVVKLGRSRSLPAVPPPDLSCWRIKVEDRGRMEAALPAVDPSKFLNEKNLLLFAGRKSYPLRSQFKKESPSVHDKLLPSAGKPRRRRSRTKTRSVQPQNKTEEPRSRKRKRRKSNLDPVDVTATKKARLDLTALENGPRSESAESASRSARATDTLVEVAEEREDDSQPPESRTDPPPSVSPPQRLSQEQDEEVDVIGASSPEPEPVTIHWTESSEEEDVDVV